MKRLEALKFKFSTIKVATNNFSNANKLGEGGFGSVYKVIQILPWKNYVYGELEFLMQ